jgi:hypothetical protein
MLWRVILGVAVMMGAASCTGGKPAPEAQARPAEQAVLPNITLRRVGGVAGFDDRILINTRGDIATSGRAIGNRLGRLTAEQTAQLKDLFAGFERLEGAYPPPEGVRDDLQYQVTYGGKVVRASTANEQLPQQFRAIVQVLEQIAGGLPQR